MLDKKGQLLLQLFISLMMAFLMTGLFAVVEFGFSTAVLSIWLTRFVIAWPIAFFLSLFVSRIAFVMVRKIVK